MYDLPKTLKKTFNIVWNLTTWENYARATIQFEQEEKRLIFYPVTLRQDQKQQLLRETLAQTVKNRRGEFYHITRNNCINNLVLLLNRVIDEPFEMWWVPNMLYNMHVTAPTHVFKTLIQKGILQDTNYELNRSNFSTVTPSLN